MLKTIGSCALLTCVLLAGSAGPVYAQQQAPAFGGGAMNKQTINVLFGGFFPKGLGTRTEGDVLEANTTFLDFLIADFKGLTIGGEWLLPVHNVLEVGAGISYFSKTVPSTYLAFVDSDGTEIDQELSLRVVPLAFTIRYLPMGQVSRNQPYIGGGLGVFMWRYHESGEFIDFAPTPPMIFDDTETYKASGTSVGPILLGGYRYAFDNLSVGGELRYQWGAGDLDPLVFAGSKIDLGGWTIHGTFGFRF